MTRLDNIKTRLELSEMLKAPKTKRDTLVSLKKKATVALKTRADGFKKSR